jgi:hypothetical protein
MRAAAGFGCTAALLLSPAPVQVWTHEYGLQGVDLAARDFRYGNQTVRGLGATSNISSGAAILEFPAELLFTADAAEGLQRVVGEKTALQGALAAERARGQESTWASYIRDLPDGAGGTATFQAFHPMLASDDLLARFPALPVTQLLRFHRAEATRQFAEWKDAAEASGSDLGDLITEEDYRWAYLVCLTRCFNVHLAVDGQPKERVALVPWGDDMNTGTSPNVWWASDSRSEKASLVFTALRDIAMGEELLIPYGAESANDRFVAEWGFTLAGNPNPLPTANCPLHVEPAAPEDPPQVYATLLALAKEYCPGS